MCHGRAYHSLNKQQHGAEAVRREVGCIPQTVIKRYLQPSVVSPHTNTLHHNVACRLWKAQQRNAFPVWTGSVAISRAQHVTYGRPCWNRGSEWMHMLRTGGRGRLRFDLVNSWLGACARIAVCMSTRVRVCVCLYHVWVVWPGGATSGSSPLTFQPRLPRPSTHRWSWKLVLAKHIFSGLCFSEQGVCQRGASGEIGLIRLVFILSYYHMLKMWSDKEAQTQS